jgi:hypothetical protein
MADAAGERRGKGTERPAGPAVSRGAWFAAVVALIVIGVGVAAVVEPEDAAQAARPPIRIGLGEDEAQDEAADGGGSAKADEDDRPLPRRLVELAAQYADGTLDLDGLRDRLTTLRLAANLVLVNHTARTRLRWLAGLGRALELASLASLLLLLGPWWVYRRRRPDPAARAAAWASAPHFAVAAAAILVVGNLLVSLVLGIEKLQVTAAAFGSPAAAAADATLHYLVYGGDADMDRILRLLLDARDAALRDPFAAAGVAGVVWVAVQGAFHSPLLAWGRGLFTLLFHLLDLYGPLLAALTLVVAWRVLAPLVRSLVRYPVDAVAGRGAPSLGRFVLDQIVLMWREIRAAIWMFGFVAVFTLLAVVAVRLLTGAAVVVLLKTLLAAAAVVGGGAPLPDAALFATMLSLLVYAVLVAGVCLVSAALIFGKAYPVVRARLHQRRRFRAFPAFWRTIGRLLGRVLWPTVVAGGFVLALYWALLLAVPSPAWRVWLPVPLLGPATAFLLWLQGVPGRLWRLAKVDPLAGG